ncbi:right-handed parallel beta-helix repeat-containing protein [Candidatus Woesearchaeota archaeon]|nr:right-handed parallel beta-helix repeat-containing protein [Candidatus Woesearchaeota archaeon]
MYKSGKFSQYLVIFLALALLSALASAEFGVIPVENLSDPNLNSSGIPTDNETSPDNPALIPENHEPPVPTPDDPGFLDNTTNDKDNVTINYGNTTVDYGNMTDDDNINASNDSGFGILPVADEEAELPPITGQIIILSPIDTDDDGDPDVTDCAPYDPNILSPRYGLHINRSITLCTGTYNIYDPDNTGIFTFSDNVTLDCNGSVLVGNRTGRGIYLNTKSNINISNCGFRDYTYGFYGYTSSGISVNNTFSDFNSYGFYYYGGSGNRIESSVARNNTNPGFYIYSSSNFNISGSAAYNNNNDGFMISEYSSNVMILNSSSYDNNRYGFSSYSYSATIENSAAYDTKGRQDTGFYLDRSGNRIIGCSAYNNTQYGIYSSYFSSQNLSHNVLMDNRMLDLGLDINSISECNSVIQNNTGSGNRPIMFLNGQSSLEDIEVSQLIMCNADGSNITNVTVYGSGLHDNNWIYLVYTDNAELRDVRSHGNYYGLFADYSNNNIIVDSSFSGSSQYGLFLTNSQNNRVYHNNFSDNHIQASSDHASNIFYSNDSGTPEGNYWSDVFTSYLNITDSNADSYGDTGPHYPYNQENFGNVRGSVADYGPVIDGYSPQPCLRVEADNTVISSDALLCPGTYYVKDADLNGILSITGDNVVIDCNGAVFEGDGYASNRRTRGVRLSGKTNITFIDCDFTRYYYAVSSESSSGINIVDSEMYTNYYAIYTYSSTGLNITNNTLHNNVYGLYSASTYNSIFINNTIRDNSYVDFNFAAGSATHCNNTVLDNTGFSGLPIRYYHDQSLELRDGEYSQLILCNMDNSNITNITINGGYRRNMLSAFFTDYAVFSGIKADSTLNGIYLQYSNDNLITGSSADNFASFGFGLYLSHGNNISNSHADRGGSVTSQGFYLSSSHHNIFSSNNATGNANKGVRVFRSDNNTFVDNNINNNQYGIHINESSLNNFSHSSVQNNTYYDVYIESKNPSNCDNDYTNITISGGHALDYFSAPVSLQDQEFYQIILCGAGGSNLTNLTIDGYSAKNNNGLTLLHSDNSVVQGIRSTGNYNGIRVHDSDNLTIRDSVFESNRYGIYHVLSDNGNITNNTITMNYGSYPYGINLWKSSYNMITGNNIRDSGYSGYSGIILNTGSDKNVIVGNHFRNLSMSSALPGSIRLQLSKDNNVTQNDMQDVNSGIYMYNASGSSVFNNTLLISGYTSYYAFGMERLSRNNNIFGNNLSGWSAGGVYVYNSSSNSIKDVHVKGKSSAYGINSYWSWNNTFSNFSIEKYITGIMLQYSDNNSFSGFSSDNNTKNGLWLSNSKGNRVSDGFLSENNEYDMIIGTVLPEHCNNIVDNITGSGNRPVLFYNSSVHLSNSVASELILCNADYADISNVTILGSDTLQNNYLYIGQTDHAQIEYIRSDGNFYGIYMEYSTDNDFLDSSTYNNYQYNLYAAYSDHNMIHGSASWYPSRTKTSYYIYRSRNNTIAGTSIYNSSSAIYLSHSNDTIIEENDIYQNTYGINLQYSNNNVVLNNNITRQFSYGQYLSSSSGNHIVNNSIYSNLYPIYLTSVSSNNNISYNNVTRNSYGMYTNSPDNIFSHNYIFNNSNYGIEVYGTGYNHIMGNNISMNPMGIYLYYAKDNSVNDNTIYDNTQLDLFLQTSNRTHCQNDIYDNTGSAGRPIFYINDDSALNNADSALLILCGADNATVSNVTVKGSDTIQNNLVYVVRSRDVIFRDVASDNNYFGFYDEYGSGNSYLNCTAVNNSDNGFYLNGNYHTINSSEAISNNYGVYVFYGNGHQLHNNIIADNAEGARIYYSNNSVIAGNNLTDNTNYGIYMRGSIWQRTNFSVHKNNISNSNRGIYFDSIEDSHITNNTIYDNYYGVYVTNSDNLTFYYNSFINNTQQAYASNANNRFYRNSTPHGNYWGDIRQKGLHIVDMDSDNFGDHGMDYPYSQANGGDVNQYVVDYGPMMGDYDSPPCYTPTGDDTMIDFSIVLCRDNYTIADSNSNGLFLISDNVALDCNGSVFSSSSNPANGLGISLWNKRNITIRNCIFRDYSQGIALQYSSNISVINSTIQKNQSTNLQYGIYIYHTNDSVINGTRASGITSNGFRLDNSDRNVIDMFEAVNVTNHGLVIVNSDNNSVTDSVFTGNLNGIYLAAGEHNTISGNLMQENHLYDFNIDYGISACRNNITGNVGSGGRDILFFNGSVSLQNMIASEIILCKADFSDLTNVTILGSDTMKNNGMFIINTSWSSFEDINSSDNYHGLMIYGGTGNDFSGITGSDNADDGLSVSHSDNNSISGSDFSRNIVYGVDLYESDFNYINADCTDNNYGIVIRHSHNNTIDRSVARDNAYRGIELEWSNDNRILDSQIFSNPMGIYLTDVSGTVINDTISCMNSDYDIYERYTIWTFNNSGNNNHCSNVYLWADEGMPLGCTDICGIDSLGMECEIDGSWQDCSDAVWDAGISRMRIQCLSNLGSITKAEFNLTNAEDADTIFFGPNFTSYFGGYYEYDNADYIVRESGDWFASAACYDDYGYNASFNQTWYVPFGELVPYLVNPVSNSEIAQYAYEDIRIGVRCEGGECGDIRATLDPRNDSANIRGQSAGSSQDKGNGPVTAAFHVNSYAPSLKWTSADMGHVSDSALVVEEINGRFFVFGTIYDDPYDTIFALDAADGRSVWNYSTQEQGCIATTPVAGDIDNDGDIEVIAYDWCGYIYILNAEDGTEELLAYDEDFWGGYSAPSLYDIDGDSYLEIFLPNDGGGPSGYGTEIKVMNYTGEYEMVMDSNMSSLVYYLETMASFGDIDLDDEPEIVVASGRYVFAYDSDGSKLWQFDSQGISEFWYTSAIIGDFDLDGSEEVAVSGNSYFYILNGSNGALLDKKGVYSGYNQIAVGNLNGNEYPDIVVGDDSAVTVYAFEYKPGEFVTGGCSGFATPCSLIYSCGPVCKSSYCESQEGCECTACIIIKSDNATENCNSSGEGDDVNTTAPIPIRNQECSGNAIQCDSFLDPVLCEQQLGCNWRFINYENRTGIVKLWEYDAGGTWMETGFSIGDADGDGDQDIFFVTSDNYLTILNGSGQELSLALLPDEGGSGSGDNYMQVPALADMDYDGDLEVVAYHRYGAVSSFDLNGSASDWPALNGNNYHTGEYLGFRIDSLAFSPDKFSLTYDVFCLAEFSSNASVVNFTVTSPEGIIIIDSQPGSALTENEYRSPVFRIDSWGDYTCQVEAADAQGISISRQIEKKTGVIQGAIPMDSGVPFYTISTNPSVNCYDLKDGESCEFAWRTYATGNIGSVWEFFGIFESVNYPGFGPLSFSPASFAVLDVNSSNSSSFNITITESKPSGNGNQTDGGSPVILKAGYIPVCGDGNCVTGEDCRRCPADCGACPRDEDDVTKSGYIEECGNNLCGNGEDCRNCPKDCGACELPDMKIVGPNRAELGELISILITDMEDNPLAFAEIQVLYDSGRSEKYTTDESGKLQFTASEEGNILLNAKMEGYRVAKKNMDITSLVKAEKPGIMAFFASMNWWWLIILIVSGTMIGYYMYSYRKKTQDFIDDMDKKLEKLMK